MKRKDFPVWTNSEIIKTDLSDNTKSIKVLYLFESVASKWHIDLTKLLVPKFLALISSKQKKLQLTLWQLLPNNSTVVAYRVDPTPL